MKYYEVDFHIQITGNGYAGTQQSDTEATATEAELMLQSMRDVIAAYAGEAGFETFEDTPHGIKGYVQTSEFDREALGQIICNLPFSGVTVTFDVHEAEYKDWNEAWEHEGFEPIEIGGRCIIHDGRHIPSGQEYDIEIEIDARMAFGTGTHETTRMVAAALLGMQLESRHVLDCGCGTGILGIVAIKNGAASATGYDIDEWSVDNARHNAIINGVDSSYNALLGDASILDATHTGYDVVVANINRNILLTDMSAFRRVMNDKGATLVLSGFYTGDIGMLEEKASSLGLHREETYEDNGWACIVLRN